MATLTAENNVLVLRSRYDANLVNAIKSLPIADRQYRKDDRAWLIAPQHGVLVASLVEACLGEVVKAPTVTNTTTKTRQTLDVRYIGSTKERTPGQERTAFGWHNGGWNVILPEPVLRTWFSAEVRPDEAPTLYSVLGIPQWTSPADLKSAYRRMARQWHPDVCKEPDAREQFERIQHAYDLLSDYSKRARYDAGLQLEAQSRPTRKDADVNETAYGYRTPLLCGLLDVEAEQKIGRVLVTKIYAWSDITNAVGKTLVVSWPKGAETFLEIWA